MSSHCSQWLRIQIFSNLPTHIGGRAIGGVTTNVKTWNVARSMDKLPTPVLRVLLIQFIPRLSPEVWEFVYDLSIHK